MGIENLGESVKQLREEIKGWEEPEVPKEAEREAMELDAQLQEVPLAISGTSEQSQPPIQLPVVSTPISSTIPPVLFPPASKPSFATENDDLAAMRSRVEALTTGTTEEWVLVQGHQKPYPGTPVKIPESSEAPVLSNVAGLKVKRITPIPVSLPFEPALCP